MVLHLPRDAVSVSVSRQVLDSCLETLGVTADTRADIALALSEACANVVQHAGAGEEYEVQVSARNRRCVIEVVNTGSQDGEPAPDARDAGDARDIADARGAADVRGTAGPQQADDPDGTDDSVAALAEHGRGLTIIDAVADNVQLTGNQRQGTTVHFEKTLEWIPGAAGQHLFSAEVAS